MSEPRDIQLKRLLSEGAITREQFEELRSSLPEYEETVSNKSPTATATPEIIEEALGDEPLSRHAPLPWQIVVFLEKVARSGKLN